MEFNDPYLKKNFIMSFTLCLPAVYTLDFLFYTSLFNFKGTIMSVLINTILSVHIYLE